MSTQRVLCVHAVTIFFTLKVYEATEYNTMSNMSQQMFLNDKFCGYKQFEEVWKDVLGSYLLLKWILLC